MTKNFDRQRKMNTESGMILKVSFLVIVFLMIILTPGVAQNKKPRKKLKENGSRWRIVCGSSCGNLLIRGVCFNGAILFSWQN